MKIKIVRDSKGEVVGTIEETTSEETQVEMELEQGYDEDEMEVSRRDLFDLDDFFKKSGKPRKP